MRAEKLCTKVYAKPSVNIKIFHGIRESVVQLVALEGISKGFILLGFWILTQNLRQVEQLLRYFSLNWTNPAIPGARALSWITKIAKLKAELTLLYTGLFHDNINQDFLHTRLK